MYQLISLFLYSLFSIFFRLFKKQLIRDIYGIDAAKSYDFIIPWTQIPEVNKHLVFIFGFVKISTEKPLINKAVYC